jgi:uncharacterized membrane protein
VPWLVAGVALLALVSWLLNTPAGLLGKADAVGYAICHRIDGRSFHLGDRQFPLCARCTGIYLGVLVGLVGMFALGRGRAGGLPKRPLLITLFGFIGLMGVDGLNSYAHFFPGLPTLYESQNWLRLVTGTLNGLALAGILYPVLNQTLWVNWEERPILGRWRELAVLVAAAGVVVLLVLSDNPIVLYPLALLSALGVVTILVALNTTILLVVSRRENQAASWRGALLPVVAGFGLAIIQIAAVDAARYAVFGNWGGFPLPG